MGSNVKGVTAHFTSISRYKPFIDAFLATHPGVLIFLATDGRPLLEQFLKAYPPDGGADGKGPRVVYQHHAARVTGHAHGISTPAHSGAKAPIGAAHDVIRDTYLMSKADYLLKTTSSVSELAIAISPSQLFNHSFDFGLLTIPSRGGCASARPSTAPWTNRPFRRS